MPTASPELKQEVKQALVRSLRLPIPAEEIGDARRCSAKASGSTRSTCSSWCSSSSGRFGVSITDEQTGTKVLRSVDAIADFITAERSQVARA